MNAPRAPLPGTPAHRRRTCFGKRRYPDQVSAFAFAVHEMEANQGLKLDAYRCRYCGGWHLFKAKPGNSRELFRPRQKVTA